MPEILRIVGVIVAIIGFAMIAADALLTSLNENDPNPGNRLKIKSGLMKVGILLLVWGVSFFAWKWK